MTFHTLFFQVHVGLSLRSLYKQRRTHLDTRPFHFSRATLENWEWPGDKAEILVLQLLLTTEFACIDLLKLK